MGHSQFAWPSTTSKAAGGGQAEQRGRQTGLVSFPAAAAKWSSLTGRGPAGANIGSMEGAAALDIRTIVSPAVGISSQQSFARSEQPDGLARFPAAVAKHLGAPPARVRSRSAVPRAQASTGSARWDEPVVRRLARGAFPSDLGSAQVRSQALSELEAEFFSASNTPAVQARIRTVFRFLDAFGCPRFPPSPAAFLCLGAGLKHGGYRSAAQYLSIYKVEAERRGHSLDGPSIRAKIDAQRSCERGQGGPRKAMALPYVGKVLYRANSNN